MGTEPLLLDAALSGRYRRAGAGLMVVAAVAALLGVAELVRPEGFGFGSGGTVTAIAASGLCCLLRAAATRRERTPWALMGLGLLATCVAWLAPERMLEVPWWNLLMWACWYPPVGIALVCLLRGRLSGVPRSLWLDSVVVGCAVAAGYTDVLLDDYLHSVVSASSTTVGIGVAIGYPLGDLVLLALVASVLVVHGWRLSRSWGLLVVALAGAAVLDGAQLSGLLSARLSTGIWPVFAVMFGWAALQPAQRSGAANVTGRRMIAAPICCALVLPVVLLHAAGDHSGFAVGLAATSYLALVVRVWLLFDDVRRATTALASAHAEADRLSRTDPLTGAANRRAFGEALNAISDEADGTGVLMVDIDHFKQINDGYGHDAGDTVIVEVTRRMSAAVRRSDVVGRWGGEEFCVLLDNVPGVQQVEAVGEKVRTAVCGQPIVLPDGQSVTVTVSVGAVFLGHITTLTVAMAAADEQLYAAKHGGRNQVCSAATVSLAA